MSIFAGTLRSWRSARGKGRVDPAALKAGATYARINAAQVVETAKILSVAEHSSGIPHVRYNCCLHRANRVFEDGPRTLALPTFLERFQSAA
jgi:hypothetical protein